jgi:hypothetical protein
MSTGDPAPGTGILRVDTSAGGEEGAVAPAAEPRRGEAIFSPFPGAYVVWQPEDLAKSNDLLSMRVALVGLAMIVGLGAVVTALV